METSTVEIINFMYALISHKKTGTYLHILIFFLYFIIMEDANNNNNNKSLI